MDCKILTFANGTAFILFEVVHPAPGNATGTLVNGILHRCSLPKAALSQNDVLSDAEDVSDVESFSDGDGASAAASVRPGIVHRLDKGTSGLLVVAKVSFFFSLGCCETNCKTSLRFILGL